MTDSPPNVAAHAAPPRATPASTVEPEVRRIIRESGSAIVALSGGVDSSVVAALAAQELGARALAVTGVSPSLAPQELADIRALCQALELAHLAVDTHELNRPDYIKNAPDRCYFCKTELYSTLTRVARERGFARILDGTTQDDLRGHRPGKRAADEHNIVSPLLLVGATKDQVRAMARGLGLGNAERPSSPCLSSRIAYGVAVTPERLERVDKAETFLKSLGFSEVRVRLHDRVARLEVPARDLVRAAELGPQIGRALKDLGFVYVTLDLLGLRSGSLLEVFQEPS